MRRNITRVILGFATAGLVAVPLTASAAPLILQPVKNVGNTGLQWKNNGSGAAISLTGTGSGYSYELTHNDALVAGDGTCATWIQGSPMQQKTCNGGTAQVFAWTSGGDMSNEAASVFLGTGACIVPIMSNTRLGAVVCPGQPIPSQDKWEW